MEMLQESSENSCSFKAFKYRLYPSKRQECDLFRILACARSFYNMCVSERKWTYELEKRSVTKNEQLRQIKHYRATFPQAKGVYNHIFQVAAQDCDKAFQAFFRRLRAGETPGYPRFKSSDRFRSFGLKEYGNGWKVVGRRLHISGVGRIPVRWHRPMEGTPKTLRVIYKAGKWYIAVTCEASASAPLPETGRVIGIDMGVSSLLTTSDGDEVENPKFYRKAQAELRRRQRKLARATKDSKNRLKAKRQVHRLHEHVANQRRNFMHKLSTELVRGYDRIALEDLRVRNMVRNHHLSKSIFDSGWSMFRQFLTYKAASAGRLVAFVDPAYTSKTCSRCGAIFEHLTLSDRWVNCDCGLSLDRDHNAAINILSRAAWDARVNGNVVPLLTPRGEGKRKRRSEATRL